MSNYEKFIAANHKLFACYDAINVDEWKALNAKDQSAVCHQEREAVRAFLKDDSVHFRQLIKTRLDSMASQQH